MFNFKNRPAKSTYLEEESQISFIFGILFLLYISLGVGIAYLVENWMPTPLTIDDELNNPDRFIAERAQNYLKGLTDFGTRVAGSYQNEVLAVNYLQEIIENIIENKSETQRIEYDISTVTGSYYLAYKPYGSINAYANLQNVVVKVYGSNSENSVLINSHFDTVIGSPGGTDDGINCAVMLEVLRKISQSTDRPTNNIIFLLNGGEEANILASHGFVTQHEWAQDVKVVINLEATGAGGKEILFQAGPEQSWLMDYYGRVPYPFAHVFGEEIFKSNLIPSDSDFRIFRDFGNIIGYDFAFFKDGYRYHTKYDGFENIELETYQRTGENILRLVQELGDAPEVGNPPESGGGAVYFDVLGLFMLHYVESTEIIVNVLTILLSTGSFCWHLYGFQIGCSRKSLLYLVLRLCNILTGWIISFIAMVLVALFLGGTNKAMSWYKIPILALGLYSTITIIFTHISAMIFGRFVKRQYKITLTRDVLTQIHLIRIIWTIIMLIGVGFRIKSVYIFVSLISFNTIFMFIIQLFKLYRTKCMWILVYLLGELIPTILLSAIAYHVLTLFIPICGRFGSSLNPEFMIGGFTVAVTILITSCYMPLFSLLSKQSHVLIFVAALFFGSIIVTLTPIGFPYSGDINHPTPQRFPVFHTQRTYHDENGDILKSDSGFYFRNMDYNSPRSIKNYVSNMDQITSLEEDCKMALFCGLPVTYSRDFEELEDNSWIPSVPPVFNGSLPSITLNSIDTVSNIIRRYYFTANGPDSMDLYLSPKEGINVSDISLNSFVPTEQPLWNDRPTIYILYATGKENAPLDFFVDFEIPENWDGLVLDMAIAGKYVHEDVNVLTEEFENFLASFPEWAVLTTVALAYYESWMF